MVTAPNIIKPKPHWIKTCATCLKSSSFIDCNSFTLAITYVTINLRIGGNLSCCLFFI